MVPYNLEFVFIISSKSNDQNSFVTKRFVKQINPLKRELGRNVQTANLVWFRTKKF